MRSNDDHFECKDVRMEDDKIMDIKKLKSEVDDFAKDLKSLISADNQQLYSGIVKFLQRYKAMLDIDLQQSWHLHFISLERFWEDQFREQI